MPKSILKQKNIQFKKLSYQGYSLKKSELTEEQLAKLKKDLTVAPAVVPGYGADEVETFELYRENDTKIYVPKHYGVKKLGKPEKNTLFKGAKIKCKFAGSLREYQKEILEAYDDHKEKYGGGIISVGAGRGKTVMAIAKIADIGLKTLILVHNTVLLNQWRERLEQYLPDARLGIIQGKKIAVKDKDVVIAMIQSLSNPKKDDEYPKEMFEDFGTLVIDECHHMGAKMFCRCLMKTMFKYCLGLSATPNRKDGLTKVFKYFIGDICYNDTAIQKTPEEKELDHIPDAEVKVYTFVNDDPEYCEVLLNWKKKPNITLMESNIANYEPRTDFIISLLPDLIKEGRKILILTSRRNHIADILMKIEEKQIASCGPYVGGMKESELEHTKQQKILVATYAMAEEGFDCQTLDTLIMATPKKELEQCAGRILRKKKNDRVLIPLIIDIKDDFSNFARWFTQRNKHYKEKNYRLSFIKIDGCNKDFTHLNIKKIPWFENTDNSDSKNGDSKHGDSNKDKLSNDQSKITDYNMNNKEQNNEPKQTVSTAEIKAHADYNTIKTYKQSFNVGLKEAYKLYLDDVESGFV